MRRKADRQQEILWDNAAACLIGSSGRKRDRLNRTHIFALDHLLGHRSHQLAPQPSVAMLWVHEDVCQHHCIWADWCGRIGREPRQM